MTYTALTQRPIALTPRQRQELEESITYDFRNIRDEGEDEDNDVTPVGTLTPVNDEITPSPDGDDTTALPWKSKEHLSHHMFEDEEKGLNITPASLQNNDLVLQHHDMNPPLKSLYAEGLRLVQSDNAINAFGEPPFTNWAQGYRETLDYIFTVTPKPGERETMKLTGLLRMPRREEMGEGEPQEGRFPSDHVCEMVEVELL